MNPGTKKILWFAFLSILLINCSLAHAQRGARTFARGLDQLAAEAEDIVWCSVRSARVEPHPQLKNLTTVVVTLDVRESLKGPVRKQMQFRQYVWDIRDKLDAAGYRKGQELLLMLGPTSEYGLRSPVGLEQGRFRIQHEPTGASTAVNGRGNLGLFETTETRMRQRGIALSGKTAALVKRRPQGPLPLEDLKEAIRTFSKGGVR